MAKSITSEEKPWVAKLKALRSALDLNQTELAAKLKINQSTVSDWERGAYAPSLDAYVRLGRLSAGVPGTEPLWFWKKAGLTKEVLAELVPEFAKSLKGADFQRRKKRAIAAGEATWVPLLRKPDYIGSLGPAPTEEIEAMIPFPTKSVPNPNVTACLKLHDKADFENLYAIDWATVRLDDLWESPIAVLRPEHPRVRIGWLHPAPPDLCLTLGLKTQLPLFSEFSSVEKIVEAENFRSGLEWQKLLEDSLLTRGTFLMRPPDRWEILGRVVAMLSSFRKIQGEDQK